MFEGNQEKEKEARVAAGWVLVEMYVTDWATAQKKDPELDAVLQWLESKKKTDLRTLLVEYTSSEEGQIIWRNCQNITVLQGTLYLYPMPKGKIEDLLLFVMPKMQWTAALNRCHWDAGHQGSDHTLSLLQEHFWWPGMAKQIRQVIGACKHCLQFEGGTSRVPLCPIVATTPLDLLHVNFTSIETTLELNKLPRVANVLVFQDHFTKHALVYVTPDQTVTTTAKFLCGGYISIFGALARLLSDRGTSFTSSINEELCKILGIKWLWTMPYHPQMNGLVERLHQTIVHMIGKLGEKKSWLATSFGWYSAHLQCHPICSYWVQSNYLMFGWWTRLKVNSVFPTIGSKEALMREASAKHVDMYIASMRDRLRTALWEAEAPSTAETYWQKWYYDRKIGTVNLKPGDLILVKVDAWKAKRKIKDRCEEETWEVVHQIMADIPSYKVTNQCGQSQVLHWNWLLLIASEIGVPLCMGHCHTWDRCTNPTPHKTTSVGGEKRRMPQEESGKAVTQWPTSKASLGWKNGKLQLLLWMSTGASTEDGWRPQVTWFGCRLWKEHIHKAEGTTSIPIDAGG